MTEAGKVAAAKKVTAKKVAGGGPETLDAQIGRLLVRALWTQAWVKANPDATPEGRKAAWLAARESAMKSNLQACRRAVGALQRYGVTMSYVAKGASQANGGDDE